MSSNTDLQNIFDRRPPGLLTQPTSSTAANALAKILQHAAGVLKRGFIKVANSKVSPLMNTVMFMMSISTCVFMIAQEIGRAQERAELLKRFEGKTEEAILDELWDMCWTDRIRLRMFRSNHPIHGWDWREEEVDSGVELDDETVADESDWGYESAVKSEDESDWGYEPAVESEDEIVNSFNTLRL